MRSDWNVVKGLRRSLDLNTIVHVLKSRNTTNAHVWSRDRVTSPAVAVALTRSPCVLALPGIERVPLQVRALVPSAAARRHRHCFLIIKSLNLGKERMMTTNRDCLDVAGTSETEALVLD